MDFRFSILVPTRQRPDTLPATLATLIEQQGDDYEIVVADNCGDAEVDHVIKAAQQQHPRIKHIRSDRVLPMAENWERGLAACSGEYITVLGDDDGFLSNTLPVVRNLLAVSKAKVFSWEVHTYWWPDTIAYWNRNRLYVTLANDGVVWKESRPTLIQAYRDTMAINQIPMIYSGIVHRDVINAVISRYGAYFVPPQIAPDVSSGIINLLFTGRFLHSIYPLAVRGNSRRSTGTSYWARSLGKEQQLTYQREEGKTLQQLTHPGINASVNIGFANASNKMYLKDLLFSHDDELQIDLHNVVSHTIANLNNEPEAYAENLADALQLAARLGMTVDPSTIPPKRDIHRVAPAGIFRTSESGWAVGVNCDLANIFDVAGAARLAAAMSPPHPAEQKRTESEAPALLKAG